jgi:uncharacterized protein (DUF1684 family)
VHERLELLEWKRRIFGLYQQVRDSRHPEQAWEHWRAVREELYTAHPQSPRLGAVPRYFDYDAAFRVTAEVEASEPQRVEVNGSAHSVVPFTRFGRARFELLGEQRSLELYWLDAYGGGVFLPFADATSGRETYGAGRYLLDTVKGSDLGGENGRLVLDFNFAYNPSCAYDDRWACPLAPPANRLDLRVEAGELTPA